MTEHIPEWIMKRYALLWTKFQEKEISRENIRTVLIKESASALSSFLSNLKKAGWMEMKLDKKDARKTIYKLKNPKEAITELIKEMAKDE